jgi:hypothetical protein
MLREKRAKLERLTPCFKIVQSRYEGAELVSSSFMNLNTSDSRVFQNYSFSSSAVVSFILTVRSKGDTQMIKLLHPPCGQWRSLKYAGSWGHSLL